MFIRPLTVAVIVFIVILIAYGSGAGKVSNEYKTGLYYKYYSDGSCINHEFEKCLKQDEAKIFCKKISGYSNGLFKSLEFHYEDKVRTLFSAGSVGALETSWSGSRCKAKITASGIYRGSSAKVSISGQISGFVVTDQLEVLAHYLDGFSD